MLVTDDLQNAMLLDLDENLLRFEGVVFDGYRPTLLVVDGEHLVLLQLRLGLALHNGCT